MLRYFQALSQFEKSRWRLLTFILVQLVTVVAVTPDENAKGAVLLAGAAALVAVLTKRKVYIDIAWRRRLIYATYIAVIVLAIGVGAAELYWEVAISDVTGGFWVWLAPAAAGILGIFDWHSTVLSPSSPQIVVVSDAGKTCVHGHPIA